mgnify:CR=1 FL=1
MSRKHGRRGGGKAMALPEDEVSPVASMLAARRALDGRAAHPPGDLLWRSGWSRRGFAFFFGGDGVALDEGPRHGGRAARREGPAGEVRGSGRVRELPPRLHARAARSRPAREGVAPMRGFDAVLVVQPLPALANATANWRFGMRVLIPVRSGLRAIPHRTGTHRSSIVACAMTASMVLASCLAPRVIGSPRARPAFRRKGVPFYAVTNLP